MQTPLALLNYLSPEAFLAEYWQKKPLLIRQAIPNFNGFLTPNELAGLACEEAVQSRIVQNIGHTWQVKHGPFDESDFAALPEQDWTLLVQSVNHHIPEAAALLSQFNFIPHARLDDLMVSFAPTGGSVGAHMDAYDVFLLQGRGKRRWKINAQPEDKTLIEDVPVKLLKHFEAEQEWVLEPGDMLYLPPNVAHHGLAEDNNCMTYSIGFRVPQQQELIHAFLEYLQDNIQVPGLYEDADLNVQKHPAEISDAMIDKVELILNNISWEKRTAGDFLGRYLSEPKPDVIFEPLSKSSRQAFTKDIAKRPIELDLKSIMLFQHGYFYINGEPLDVPVDLVACMRLLADKRYLDGASLNKTLQIALANTLYPCYEAGYIHIT
jgi:50S ribosomal protein L16 3-hydroxylase